MLFGKYDRFLTNEYHIRSVCSSYVPHIKKYDTWVKIDDVRGVLIRRTVVLSFMYTTILQVSTWYSVEKNYDPTLILRRGNW